jgi:hypothetical protein
MLMSGRLAAFQSKKRWTRRSKRENASALPFRVSETRQYRQIWAHGAWRKESVNPLASISLGTAPFSHRSMAAIDDCAAVICRA